MKRRIEWKFKLNVSSISILLTGMLLNLVSSWIAQSFSLPFLFDTVGTVYCAASLGPVAAIISGIVSSCIYATNHPFFIVHAFVNICVGVIVGIFYPRKSFDFFQILCTAAISAIASIILSTVINLKFHNGYMDNLWGDAFIDMLRQSGNSITLCAVMGEIFIDMPDKILTLFIVTAILRLKEKFASAQKSVDKLSVFLICVLVMPLFSGIDVSADNFSTEYDSIVFNSESGLNSLEINSIAQTDDGYIWAGSYSGLYRYNGSKFVTEDFGKGISSIIVLYNDTKGRLWVGTNDKGLLRYEPETGDVVIFDADNGLTSNSVRSIEEDAQGNIYIGTSEDLFCIYPDDSMRKISVTDNIVYITSLDYSKSDILGGVTNSGIAFFLNNGTLICYGECDAEDGVYYSAICSMPDGRFLIGTSMGGLYTCDISNKTADVKKFSDAEGASVINKIVYDEVGGGYFICAENDVGYLSSYGKYISLAAKDFDCAVSDVIRDYQDNIWFTSDKQGVNLMTKNPFIDIFDAADIDNRVVNAVAQVGNDLYIGCDDGLIVLDSESYTPKNYSFIEQFDSVKVRNFLVDSKNNIWISTYGIQGLVCIAPDHSVTSYNESNSGTMGGRFRFSTELSDGTILAAAVKGLTYIADGKVIGTIGERDGLSTTQILSIVELPDGKILAGSDGDGIYVIEDGKIIDNIGADDGLKSLVVLRIVECTGGYLYITSSSIYYDDGKTITHLTNFPNANNYDVHITDNGEAWINGSNGIYIVSESDLLLNNEYNYLFLNQQKGFDTTLTANAWNYIDSDNNYYLCCSTGVKRISITDYDSFNDNFSLKLNRIVVGTGEVVYEKDGKYTIPAASNRITIYPDVLNYTRSNPLIHMYLEGFDDVGVTLYQNELEELDFTNLPYGNYKFHIEILDDRTRAVQKEYIVPLEKEAQFFEYTFFKVYLISVFVFIVVFFTWILAKYGSVTIIKRQYEEIHTAKEEAERANRAKSRFLAHVSHEIRTPINTIMGMDELILREDIPAEVRRYASNIKTASGSLLSLVNDILDFSKIESGKMHIVEQEYRTAEVFAELSEMLCVKAAEKNLEAVIDFDENIPAGLCGDSVRLKQIVINLLSNAVKYTEKGTVYLTVKSERTDDDKVIFDISVKDTGIGIRESEMENLFKNFERLDEKRNAKIQGTGLGLSITRELLKLMGSDLKVESEYGKGSEFSFSIIQTITDAENMELSEAESDYGNTYAPQFYAPDATILVIDDNAMNLEVIRGLLRETGIKIDGGKSGAECLEMIKKQHYDVILLDHMMPEMDGLETFEHIKSENHLCKATPVIALTANAGSGARNQYILLGFADYLPKPVTGTMLEEALYRHIPSKYHKTKTQAVEEVVIVSEPKPEPKSESEPKEYKLLNISEGMYYCCNNNDFYKNVMTIYIEQSQEKIPDIKTAFEKQDWNNYTTHVHGLKSTSRTIGAAILADEAEKLEKAGKADDIDYIISNNDKVIKLYEETLVEVQKYVEAK